MMFQFLSKQPLQLNAVDWLRAKVLANHRSPVDSWIKGLFVKNQTTITYLDNRFAAVSFDET